jgi:hypothetical protein
MLTGVVLRCSPRRRVFGPQPAPALDPKHRVPALHLGFRFGCEYDALSLFEARHTFRIQQDNAVPMIAVDRYQTTPSIEMVIGHWYLDELGNPTREIKARN